MAVALMTIDFSLPGVAGLKGRRKVLNSIKESLRHLNLSVIDDSGEYPAEASIQVALVARTEFMAEERVKEVERHLFSRFPEYEFNVSSDLL